MIDHHSFRDTCPGSFSFFQQTFPLQRVKALKETPKLSIVSVPPLARLSVLAPSKITFQNYPFPQFPTFFLSQNETTKKTVGFFLLVVYAREIPSLVVRRENAYCTDKCECNRVSSGGGPNFVSDRFATACICANTHAHTHTQTHATDHQRR